MHFSPSSISTFADGSYNAYSNQIKECTQSGSNCSIEILDIHKKVKSCIVRKSICPNQEELNACLRCTADFTTRIFLISQKNSWTPMQVTSEMLDSLTSHHTMMPQVYDLFRCFRYRNLQTEDGFCCPVQTKRSKTSYEMCHLYKYAQKKEGYAGDPWVIRQTGVYHQYDKDRNRSTWLLINPCANSSLESRLKVCLNSDEGRQQLADNHMLLHNLVISTYLPNWREYMEYYEDELLTISNTLATILLRDTPIVNHDHLLRLRSLESRFLPLSAILHSFKKTLKELQNATASLTGDKDLAAETLQELDNYGHKIDAYLENSKFLIQRTQAACQQMSDTLNFKNQDIAKEQSGYVFRLTQSTVDDSTTIRVITLATLFYLPFSFIATIMGMNFFALDTSTRHVIVSPQFWIYFGLSIPLTAMTIAFWRWRVCKRAKRHGGVDAMSINGEVIFDKV